MEKAWLLVDNSSGDFIIVLATKYPKFHFVMNKSREPAQVKDVKCSNPKLLLDYSIFYAMRETMKKSEQEWASEVAGIIEAKLNEKFPLLHLSAKTGINLIYANEILEYVADNPPEIKKMEFETDILIFQKSDDGKKWKPRVVIETKIEGVTTHDAITYSKKAAQHKSVHPYLRYGIFIGKIDHIPGRLFRHGENFDFMVSWTDYTPNKFELDGLIKVIELEIEASIKLEEILYDTRNKARAKYFILHRPLELHPAKQS